jgi:predicted phosphoribosyltransferase
MSRACEEPMLFRDRAEAGRRLAKALAPRGENSVVYALPRGGVPVAAEIAKALGAPLDLIFARKIGAPSQPELALGAVVNGERPEIVLNLEIIAKLGVSPAEIERLAADQLAEIHRRRALYLGAVAPISAQEKNAILVDDGIATGASMEAAIHALRRRQPRKLVVAVPVAARDAVERLGALADEIVALATPDTFLGVGDFYRDFHQLDDAEVIAIMAQFSPDATRGALSSPS